MKKEILDELIKVANSLEAIGLYKEASNVDRIAQNIQFNPRGSYEHFINEYKRHFKEDGANYASEWMNSLLKWKSQPGGYGNWSQEKRDAFRAQAARTTLNEKAQDFSNRILPSLLKQFSIDTITDQSSLDQRWERMTQYANKAYYYYYGEFMNAVLRKTKNIYDAKMVKFKS